MSRRRLSTPSLLILLSVTISAAAGEQTNPISAVDTVIRNRAFVSLLLHRAGRPFHVPLPSNLSAVAATAIRLRGADLWLRGAGVGSFHLPPGIFTVPYAKRALLVFHDLGNLSESYFTVSGHVLVAPVMGFLAYDASNLTFVTAGIRELSLRPTGDPITISFPAPAAGFMLAAARCVLFMADGSASVGAAVTDGMRCAATGTGHFSVVVPVGVTESPERRAEAGEKGGSKWLVWVLLAVGCGVMAAAAAAGLGLRVRRVRRRRVEEMERKAEEGEVLDRVLVRGSEMPAAAPARTRPVIESENVAE